MGLCGGTSFLTRLISAYGKLFMEEFPLMIFPLSQDAGAVRVAGWKQLTIYF